MEDIDKELISLLSTKIGMLMEDQSAKALTAGGQPENVQKFAVGELTDASTKIAKLAAAAQSILE